MNLKNGTYEFEKLVDGPYEGFDIRVAVSDGFYSCRDPFAVLGSEFSI
jgi:hypothetical protein